MRSLPAYLRSLQLTARDEGEVFFPGHGPSIVNHQRLANERRERHERKKEAIGVKTIDGGTAFDIARRFWEVTAQQEPFLVLSETLGHLDLLEEEGRLTAERDGALVRYRC
jgi:hypothetical protein